MVSAVVLIGPVRAPVQPRCLPRPRWPAPAPRLPQGPAAAGGRGGRHRGRRQPAGTDVRRVREAAQAGAGCADAPGHRAADRPRLLPDIEGMDKRGYVPDLFEHLACADAAVVQGGLSTTMELVATGRPFIYFPLRRHWEQQHFVTHRLDHYRAGLRMDYTTTTADHLGPAMRGGPGGRRTRPPVGPAAPAQRRPYDAKEQL